MTDVTDIYAQTVDQLAGRDVVHPTETLKERVVSLLDKANEVAGQELAEDPLEPLRPDLEVALAVALPLVEYGHAEGQRAVVTALQIIADEATSRENRRSGPLLFLALHDLTWALTAHGLNNDVPELVLKLADVSVVNAYGVSASIFEASDVRHPAAFGESAGHAYDNLVAWLAGSQLRGRVPLMRRDEAVQSALAEAELIAALRFAASHARESYCHTKNSGVAERRLRARVRNLGAQNALAHLYSTTPAELRDTLQGLYAQLAGPEQWIGSGELFTEDELAG